MTQPTITESGRVSLDVNVSMSRFATKEERRRSTLPPMSCGFELDMRDHTKVTRTYCLVQASGSVMHIDISVDELEELTKVMREEIKRINEGKYVEKVVAQ